MTLASEMGSNGVQDSWQSCRPSEPSCNPRHENVPKVPGSDVPMLYWGDTKQPAGYQAVERDCGNGYRGREPEDGT
jgi:hypothetical protein